MQGLTSYTQMDKVSCQILEESGKKMTASQILDNIFSNYKTSKLNVNPKKIAARLRRIPEVSVFYTKRGTNLYQYKEV